MHLLESGEMYLETIYILQQKQSVVHASEIAEYMGFSRPSVSHALGLLKSGNMITVEKDSAIVLTEEGKKVAEKIYERHTTLTTFLIQLGVCETVATEDACKIEHDISDESLQCIKNYLLRNKRK